MSGGVDSSVAAARLVAQGYDVIGVTLHLWDYPDDGSVKGRCCAPEDLHDARRVADKLGIFHYTYDRRAEFEQTVVTPFVEHLAEQGQVPAAIQSLERARRTLRVEPGKLLEREINDLAARLKSGKFAKKHQVE